MHERIDGQSGGIFDAVFPRIRSAKGLLARTASRNSMMRAIKSRWVWRNSSREVCEPVSSTVPSANTIRMERRVRYEFSLVPFIPLALLATIPPIIAEPTEAGSGPILRPNGLRIWFKRAPTIPAWLRITAPLSSTSYFSQPCEASTSTESVDACPERLVPAARKVTGTL